VRCMPSTRSGDSMRLLVLHAAAIAAPRGALLILGHSGAGKSTLCRLVAGVFPTLADDMVCLMRTNRGNGVWLVADGKQGLGRTEHALPLRAIIRVVQGDKALLIPAGAVETCRHLVDALYETEAQRRADLQQRRASFAVLAGIARQYDGWRLLSTLGTETTELIRQVLC
jgi:ABC-type glutathione transport system ATPase component